MRFRPASEKPKELLNSYYCKVRDMFGKTLKKTVLITLDGAWQSDFEVIEWLDEQADAIREDAGERAIKYLDSLKYDGSWSSDQIIAAYLAGSQSELSNLDRMGKLCMQKDGEIENLLNEKAGEFEMKRLYEWIMDENRKPAVTFFTSGWLRNVAKEIEFMRNEIKILRKAAENPPSF
jgi:hypothetical protein